MDDPRNPYASPHAFRQSSLRTFFRGKTLTNPTQSKGNPWIQNNLFFLINILKMQNFILEIVADLPIYLILAFLTFLNIIIPLSGSSTQTPLLTVLIGDANYAIAISSWLLMISCAMISFVFRKDIRKDYLWKLLPASVLGAILGAFLLMQLPNWLVTLVLFFLSVYFLYKTLIHMFLKKRLG
jgi:hypothetical protein